MGQQLSWNKYEYAKDQQSSNKQDSSQGLHPSAILFH